MNEPFLRSLVGTVEAALLAQVELECPVVVVEQEEMWCWRW